jgi:hypothetical protein
LLVSSRKAPTKGGAFNWQSVVSIGERFVYNEVMGGAVVTNPIGGHHLEPA